MSNKTPLEMHIVELVDDAQDTDPPEPSLLKEKPPPVIKHVTTLFQIKRPFWQHFVAVSEPNGAFDAAHSERADGTFVQLQAFRVKDYVIVCGITHLPEQLCKIDEALWKTFGAPSLRAFFVEKYERVLNFLVYWEEKRIELNRRRPVDPLTYALQLQVRCNYVLKKLTLSNTTVHQHGSHVKKMEKKLSAALEENRILRQHISTITAHKVEPASKKIKHSEP